MQIKQTSRPYFLLKAAAIAAIATVCGTDMLQDAVANGDTRTLSFHHVHSGETATVTFKRDGRYDSAALAKLNVLLQDWRRKEPTKMDPQLFDIVWEVYRETDATAPIEVIGGYRSPATNAMLRSRSRGVAQMSQHMLGKAMDFYIPGVPLAKIREAGLRLQRGGVGFYPTSGSPFVHLDTGGIRHWPRMTRDQLARVFPDGRTVHIPADGKPMPKYALALAEVEAQGSRPGGAGAAFASASSSGKSVKNIFASLFNKKEEPADDEEGAGPAPASAAEEAAPALAAAPPPAAPAVAAAASVVAAAAVPLPTPRPAGAGVTAAAPVLAAAAPLANVPLPPARPGASGLAAAGPAIVAQVAVADVPLPRARPIGAPDGEAPPVSRPAVLAVLDTPAQPGAHVPMPLAHENATVGEQADARNGAAPRADLANVDPAYSQPATNAALPPLILHGSTDPQPPMLSYASAGDFVVARPSPGRAPEPAVVPLPDRSAAVPRSPHSPEKQEEIRRLFNGPSVASASNLRAPEMRRFAAFIDSPRQIVDGGFGRDASGGLATTRFTGAAVIAVPVVTLASAEPAPAKKRVSMAPQ